MGGKHLSAATLRWVLNKLFKALLDRFPAVGQIELGVGFQGALNLSHSSSEFFTGVFTGSCGTGIARQNQIGLAAVGLGVHHHFNKLLDGLGTRFFVLGELQFGHQSFKVGRTHQK